MMASEIIDPTALPEEFVKSILNGIDKEADLIEYKLSDIDATDSILTFLAQLYQSKYQGTKTSYVGFFKIIIEYMLKGRRAKKNVVVKCKPPADIITDVLPEIGRKKDEEHYEIFKKNIENIVIHDTEHREIELYRIQCPVVKAICPEIYFTIDDRDKNVYIIAMEDLSTDDFILQKSINASHLWEEHHIENVLKDLAFFHAKYLDSTEDVPVHLGQFLSCTYSVEKMKRSIPFVHTCLNHNKVLASEVYDKDVCKIIYKSLDHVDEIYTKLCTEPHTFAHGDVHQRNLCLRKTPKENQRLLCLYDWEICGLHVPHLDVLDFIFHVLQEDSTPAELDQYLNKYRESLIRELKTLSKYSIKLQKSLEKDNFYHVFYLCVLHTIIFRYGVFTFFHVYHPHDFFFRICKVLIKYTKLRTGTVSFLKDI